MTAPPATRVSELARMLEGTAVTLLALTENDETLVLRRDAAPAPASPPGSEPGPEPGSPPGLSVAAPCPGVFLSRHPLRREPLAAPGTVVAAGTVLGLLRAGPLLLAVAAPRAGVLLAVEAADGDLVGYGTPLFRLAPDPGEDP